MRRASTPLTALLLLAAAAAGAAPPPAAVLQRLGDAFASLDRGRFVGSFTVTARSRVAKPSGADAEETLDVRRVTRHADGTSSSQVLRHVEDGRREAPAAEARAGDGAEAGREHPEERGDGPDEHSFSPGGDEDFRLPAGADAALFAFSEARREGTLLVARFEPAPAHRRDKGMTRGRLAWDPLTGDPAWIEADFVRHPTGLKRMLLRLELARQGDVVFLQRTVTDVLAGFLWIKRQVHVEVVIGDVTPEEALPAPSPAS